MYPKATASDADIVVIMLGTNDAKANNWKLAAEYFRADYAALIEVFRAMASSPRVSPRWTTLGSTFM